jgi:hypothetical protein
MGELDVFKHEINLTGYTAAQSYPIHRAFPHFSPPLPSMIK